MSVWSLWPETSSMSWLSHRPIRELLNWCSSCYSCLNHGRLSSASLSWNLEFPSQGSSFSGYPWRRSFSAFQTRVSRPVSSSWGCLGLMCMHYHYFWRQERLCHPVLGLLPISYYSLCRASEDQQGLFECLLLLTLTWAFCRALLGLPISKKLLVNFLYCQSRTYSRHQVQVDSSSCLLSPLQPDSWSPQ